MNKKFYIRTFGCQMNVADSAVMGALLSQAGFEEKSAPEEADVIIFNSCSVRDHSEQRLFSNMGSLMKKFPEKKFILAGCTAAKEGTNIFKRFPLLSGIISPSGIFSVVDAVKEVLQGKKVMVMEGEYGFVERKGELSEFVVIQTGCNNFCSFCIVPFVRGREKYRSPSAILKEINCLVSSGTKEVTLLGQNVNSYKGENHIKDFTDLIREVSKIEDLLRVRFLTSHPKDMPDKLIEEFAQNRKLASHIHLPVQSGSDRILAAMRRFYTAEDYLILVSKLRSARKDIAITTDVMCGFPGETEDDFKNTLELIRKAEFEGVYVFKYSPRPKTFSARSENVPEEVKERRHREILELVKKIAISKREKQIGRRVEVLFEEDNIGHTSQNFLVFKEGAKKGEFLEGVVSAVEKDHLLVEVK